MGPGEGNLAGRLGRLAVLAGLLCGPQVAAAGEDDGHAAYLAGICAACHTERSYEQAIPALAGKAPAAFLAAMQAFRSGARANQVMAAVAKMLDDEEIAALARHFAAIGGAAGGAQGENANAEMGK